MALQLFKIADVTVASPQAVIEFTSIPSGYTDLILKMSLRTNEPSPQAQLNMRVNGTTDSVWSYRHLTGDGSSASSGSDSGQNNLLLMYVNGNTATANTFSSHEIYIPNYAGSTNKSISSETVQENNSSTAYARIQASLRSATSAITSIQFQSFGTTFVTNSTATLYGVL